MKTRSAILSALFIFSLFINPGCNTTPGPKKANGDNLKGSVSISGAFALYPMAVKWAEEFQQLHPDVRIDISAGGAGKGMTDVLSGMVDLAMVSREVNAAEFDKGAWPVAVTKDAVLATINDQNPVLQDLHQKGFTQEIFKAIFLSETTHTWGEFLDSPNSSQINVYTRSDACGAAEMWGKFLDENQESLMGIGVFGDPGIADAIKNDINGIGFNNVIYAYDINSRKKYDGIAIIPLDLNGNRLIDPEEDFYESLDSVMRAIQTNIYPSPPARELYLVSKGQPNNAVVLAFLEWILTEGQQYVHEGGYVQLSPDKIESELSKLR